MSRIKIIKDNSGSWSVTEAMMLDFDSFQGTALSVLVRFLLGEYHLPLKNGLFVQTSTPQPMLVGMIWQIPVPIIWKH